MKPFGHSVVAAGAFAVAILGAPGALAVPTFDNNDLKGEYLFTVVEVRRITLPGGAMPIEHCVFAGTATFDGQGMVALSAAQRCSISGSGAFTESQYYSVNPDGSFLISVLPDMTDPVHGQIVDHGRSLLLDGTLRTLPELVNWWGMAMRR